MSFLPHQCHSFRITVIPSVLLSFLPDYCHSFRIGVIPSKYCHSFRIIQRITNSNQLQKLPTPKGREKWPPEVAIYASNHKKYFIMFVLNKFQHVCKIVSNRIIEHSEIFVQLYCIVSFCVILNLRSILRHRSILSLRTLEVF